MNIDVYTDGSCQKNCGGYAFVLVLQEKIILEKSSGTTNTTNNQMELEAIIQALSYMLYIKWENKTINLFSDSQYGILGINQWIYKWKENNWKTKQRSEVKNKSYWIRLHKLQMQFTNLKFHWIYGHRGNIFNEKADILAKQEAFRLLN